MRWTTAREASDTNLATGASPWDKRINATSPAGAAHGLCRPYGARNRRMSGSTGLRPWLGLLRRYAAYAAALLLVTSPSAHAQQEPQQPFTIKIDTQLVLETVVVKDKDGK